jgi:hypothetical protein
MAEGRDQSINERGSPAIKNNVAERSEKYLKFRSLRTRLARRNVRTRRSHLMSREFTDYHQQDKASSLRFNIRGEMPLLAKPRESALIEEYEERLQDDIPLNAHVWDDNWSDRGKESPWD